MVEWKELKEIFDTRNGYTPSTLNESFWEGGCIPWFKMDDIRDHGRILNDSYLHITEKAIKGKGLFRANSILLATSATIGEHALIAVEHLSNQRFTNFYPKKEYEKKINMRFAYYYMFIIDTWCLHHVNQGGFASVDMSGLYKQPFPIPSLEEQRRIVSILDTFTSSIENLKEQIVLRRKQYEYYRDQLLDLEGKPGVEMKILKDVFDTRNGYTPSTSNSQFWDNGIIPWFKMEDIRDNGRILNDSNLHITTSAIKGKGLFKANSIILATSATIGEHALITVEHLSNQRFTNFYPKECYLNIINMKFVYYYMYRIDEWCKQHINKGGFASVDMGGLNNLLIPIPSPFEQQRIVDILDKFEESIQNLEAQLAQREKQYEYYRNKLLTFE